MVIRESRLFARKSAYPSSAFAIREVRRTNTLCVYLRACGGAVTSLAGGVAPPDEMRFRATHFDWNPKAYCVSESPSLRLSNPSPYVSAGL
jgi:hypothetical protein